MIKFFRKIRQNLLMDKSNEASAKVENKTRPNDSVGRAGKYFKYAISEIVLVVIGILIAIQLNEWRNDIINTKQKQKVLVTLKTDFEVSLTRLDTVYYHQ